MNEVLHVLAKNRHTYFIERLIEEIGDRLQIISPWEEGLDQTFHGPVLVRTSAVYGSERDLEFLEQNFSPAHIINPLKALRTLRSKLTQFKHFAEWDIPHLPWLDLQSATLPELQAFLGTQHEWLIKPHRGQGGWGIQVLDRSQLLQWFRDQRDREYLVQPFMENAPEYRCFFTPDWLCTLKREASSVARNFRQGGEARVCENLDELTKIIQRLRRETGILYGALDALATPQGLMVLECNSVPGIEQLELVSGENVMRRILSSVLK